MKSLLRLGVLATLVAGLVVLATPGGGLREPDTVSAVAPHNLRIDVVDPSLGLDHQFLITRPSPCGPSSAALDNGQFANFSCAEPGQWNITVNPATNRSIDSVACTVSDLNDDIVNSDISDMAGAKSSYSLAINDNEDVTCVFTFEGTGSGGVGEGTDPLDPDGDGVIEYVAIAVTADPNVIACGGTTILTATARAIDTGWVVPSELLGFHWETDQGILNVGPPNTAEAMDNIATLTLLPGMTSATVRAWVADASANPGVVTVQQFCPGVSLDNDQSKAPGAITLSASSNTATCGETIFIGARVRDSKNQVVENDTVVSFIASGGEFQTGAGVVTDYSAGGDESSAASTLNTVSQYNAATVAGVLNLTWIAPLYNGDISITAAAGDKFAKLIISVKCAYAPATTVSGGGGGSAPPACTPIGDGICITAPSTGARITPPSTGDAGLN